MRNFKVTVTAAVAQWKERADKRNNNSSNNNNNNNGDGDGDVREGKCFVSPLREQRALPTAATDGTPSRLELHFLLDSLFFFRLAAVLFLFFI